MRVLIVFVVAAMLAGCAGRPLLMGADDDGCRWVGSHAERAEAAAVSREAEQAGRSPEDVAMAPVRAGDRIDRAGRAAWAQCKVAVARSAVEQNAARVAAMQMAAAPPE